MATETKKATTEQVKEAPAKAAKAPAKSASALNLVAIRIRGEAGISPQIKSTLQMLGLTNQHVVKVYPNAPNVVGMLKKAKDYITWGEISTDMKKQLEDKKMTRLHPPRGGYERKGIKQAFTVGGALGYRGEKINDLLVRMM